jgi:protein-L-isoaspartate(D-aspartate) O-methyltransferase
MQKPPFFLTMQRILSCGTRASGPPVARAQTARWPGHLSRLVVLLAFAGTLDDAVLAQQDRWAAPRAAMVRTIQAHAALLPEAASTDGISTAVLDVMGKVPRHEFVPERVEGQAYADAPLPIGYGQTISQPFIVALMTHLVRASPDSRVLEIGTGSGYQAAVLSPLVKTVCTIEIIPGLGETAARRLKDLGYDNVQTKIGDGYFGWPECGPFDGILVTAAAGHVPPPLVKQLKPGGRMVIPVGSVFGPQFLTLVEKTGGGQITTRQLLPVRFVPLTQGSQ